MCRNKTNSVYNVIPNKNNRIVHFLIELIYANFECFSRKSIIILCYLIFMNMIYNIWIIGKYISSSSYTRNSKVLSNMFLKIKFKRESMYTLSNFNIPEEVKLILKLYLPKFLMKELNSIHSLGSL